MERLGCTAVKCLGSNSLPDRTHETRYHVCMIAHLSKELTTALHATGDSELEVVDPETQRRYVLVDCDTHYRAMEALRRQQDHAAIAEGLAQMEAGAGKPLDQAFHEMRERLDFARAR